MTEFQYISVCMDLSRNVSVSHVSSRGVGGDKPMDYWARRGSAVPRTKPLLFPMGRLIMNTISPKIPYSSLHACGRCERCLSNILVSGTSMHGARCRRLQRACMCLYFICMPPLARCTRVLFCRCMAIQHCRTPDDTITMRTPVPRTHPTPTLFLVFIFNTNSISTAVSSALYRVMGISQRCRTTMGSDGVA